VKARLGYSPDDGDAFALTFARPVAARDRHYDRTMEAVGMPALAAGAGDHGV
jgi:hypothetical protein